VLALALLGNVSMRLIQSSSSGFLAVLLGLTRALRGQQKRLSQGR
jgi:hypothetical protein